MNPLDQLTQLFVQKYGASPQEARRQAAYYINRGDDEMGASFIYEAAQLAKAQQAQQMKGFQEQTAASNAKRPLGPTVRQLALTEPGAPHRLANDPQYNIHGHLPVAPVPIIAAANTPAHLEDANLSAWQRYAQMLESMPPPSGPTTNTLPGRELDQSTGMATGKRR